jgi:methionyl-tRNA formyltransferase
MWKLVSHAAGLGQHPATRQLLRAQLQGTCQPVLLTTNLSPVSRRTICIASSRTKTIVNRVRLVDVQTISFMQRLFLHYHGSLSKFLPSWWSSYRAFSCVSPALVKVTTCGRRAKPNRLSSFSASSTSSVSPPPKWRVLFFGTDDFALETLKLLQAELLRRDEKGDSGGCVAELEVVCPRLRTLVPAVARYAATERLRLHTWPLEPEVLLPAAKFDIGVVASFGHLIPGKVIGAFPRGILNVHGSLLPRWRGAAPIIHALRAGATETGLTVMKIRAGRFDVGDIVATERVAVGEDERRPELTRRMADVGARLLVAVLRDLERYEAESRPQPLEGISHAPAVDKSLAFIDFSTQGRC